MASHKIGALAERVGTNVPTIRYYEQVGLLPRAQRNDRGQRRYSEDDVGRLVFVRRCRDFGFAIDDVRELLAARHDGQRPCADARELALRNLATVSARIDALQALAAELAALVRQCDPACATGCGADCVMLQSLAESACGVRSGLPPAQASAEAGR